ncbi:hypothetical protein GQF61_05460 [Sphingobacterium sp. DK4209]|uniref:Nucleotidyltransferase family protein n=1 Tax=Sphingobacterium zhuxiongii TaxID=2662364 RepID=A0A5Q0QA07_9SPHI|nr:MULTISPECIES: nucleotidyltransferase family protein [unclassified Sphingobacterium]MVZ65293.1 hypothetical protein [Sphingobacterium sp. DK4209]QGA26383.1 hypothetical protein GFH32_08605 [Sphingobacterium sp. dk4302]
MNENRVLSAFFELLRSGLWDRSLQRLDYFPLSRAEWQKLYDLSVNHTVEGVIFDGLQRLDLSLLPGRDLLVPWAVRIEKIEQRNKWMDKVINEQVHFFNSHEISPILLKGQGLSNLYPNPLRRICGDIDWCFESKAVYDKARKVVEEKGIDVNRSAGYSENYMWDNCEVEHHQKMFDIHNPFMKGYINRFEKNENKKKSAIYLNNIETLIPSPIATLLQVNLHILKHLLSFGIGIRQLCDSARAYFALYSKYDKASLYSLYKAIGIVKWVNLLHIILVDHFGLSEDVLPFPLNRQVEYKWMLSDILEAGNFGFFHESYANKENEVGHRVDSGSRIFSNLTKYFKVAPKEAISFPVMHFISRFSH